MMTRTIEINSKGEEKNDKFETILNMAKNPTCKPFEHPITLLWKPFLATQTASPKDLKAFLGRF